MPELEHGELRPAFPTSHLLSSPPCFRTCLQAGPEKQPWSHYANLQLRRQASSLEKHHQTLWQWRNECFSWKAWLMSPAHRQWLVLRGRPMSRIFHYCWCQSQGAFPASSAVALPVLRASWLAAKTTSLNFGYIKTVWLPLPFWDPSWLPHGMLQLGIRLKTPSIRMELETNADPRIPQ